MNATPVTLNWFVGWWLILAGFASGAVIGLFFHQEKFLGGYGSFRRRLLRLGHIACAALGMLNLIVAVAPVMSPLLAVGGVLMPTVCFLTAWKAQCRHLFAIPVLALVAGVVVVMWCSGASVKRPVVAGQLPALHRSAATTGD
ncbi:MAG: LapA family protein [Verrucomicrobiota bacterium]